MNTQNPNTNPQLSQPSPGLLPPPIGLAPPVLFDPVPSQPQEAPRPAGGILPPPSATDVVLRTQVKREEVVAGAPESIQAPEESLGVQVRKTIESYLNEALIQKHATLLDGITSLLDEYDTENSEKELPAPIKNQIKKKEENIFEDADRVITDTIPALHQEYDETVAKRVDHAISGGSTGTNTSSRIRVIKDVAAERLDAIINGTRKEMAEEIGSAIWSNTVHPKDDPELVEEMEAGKQKALRLLFGDPEGEQDGLHRRLDALEGLRINSGLFRTGRAVIGMRPGSEEAAPKLDAKVEPLLKDIYEYIKKQKSLLPALKSGMLMVWLDDNRKGGFDEETARQQVQTIVSGLRERIRAQVFDEESLELLMNLEVIPLLTSKYPNLVSQKEPVRTESATPQEVADPSRLLTEAVAEQDRPEIALQIFEYVADGGDIKALAVLLSSVSAIDDKNTRATIIKRALQRRPTEK